MAGQAREPATLRPAPVAVHDDGDVARSGRARTRSRALDEGRLDHARLIARRLHRGEASDARLPARFAPACPCSKDAPPARRSLRGPVGHRPRRSGHGLPRATPRDRRLVAVKVLGPRPGLRAHRHAPAGPGVRGAARASPPERRARVRGGGLRGLLVPRHGAGGGPRPAQLPLARHRRLALRRAPRRAAATPAG